MLENKSMIFFHLYAIKPLFGVMNIADTVYEMSEVGQW